MNRMRMRPDLIEEWAGEQFPRMKGSTADEWRLFLNQRTGTDIQPDTPMPKAFDAWRRVLGIMQQHDPKYIFENGRLILVARKLNG